MSVDDLLTRLAPPRPLRPDQVARIRSAIDDAPPPSWRMPRSPIAIAVFVALCGAAAAAAYQLTQADHAPSAEVIEPPPAPPVEISVVAPKPSPAVAIDPRQPVVIAPPHKPPVIDREPIRAPHIVEVPPAPRAATVPPTQPPTPTPPPMQTTPATPVQPAPTDAGLAAESQLIALGLRQMRKDHAPRAALDTLDRYAAEFPHGVLAEEAKAARIEALVSLGDRTAALALLDAMQVGTELAVLRGELRLAAGRPQEAAADFTAVLVGARDDLEARALFGRAACRTRLHDRDGARADLGRYVERFPHGPSASAARAALDEIDRGSSNP